MGNTNDLLSFWIPTYNRASVLREALLDLIPKIKNFEITIGICDNNSTDDTSKVVSDFCSVYNHICYYKNETNIGADFNILECYKYAQTDYICVLGDSYRIKKNAIPEILETLKNESPSLLIANRGNLKIPTKTYDNINDFLFEIGGSLDLVGVLFLPRKAVSSIYYGRYSNSNFIHLAMAVEYLCSCESVVVSWLKDCDYEFSKLKRSGTWYNRSVQIFLQNWVETVMSFPPTVKMSTKLKMIRDHELWYSCFSIYSVYNARRCGIYEYCDIYKYRIYLYLVTKHSLLFYFILFHVPLVLLRFLLYSNKQVHKIFFFLKES